MSTTELALIRRVFLQALKEHGSDGELEVIGRTSVTYSYKLAADAVLIQLEDDEVSLRFKKDLSELVKPVVGGIKHLRVGGMLLDLKGTRARTMAPLPARESGECWLRRDLGEAMSAPSQTNPRGAGADEFHDALEDMDVDDEPPTPTPMLGAGAKRALGEESREEHPTKRRLVSLTEGHVHPLL